MSKITQFNRTNLKAVNDEINDVLSKVLEKYGLSVKLGDISFDDNSFKTKLTVSTGSKSDSLKRDFEKHAPKFGLKKSDFGKTINWSGEVFKIVGIKPRSTKYPLLAEKKGVVYKLPLRAAA